MYQSVEIIVVGGSAAGLAAASSARAWYPNKKVMVVRNVPFTVIPCAIPYAYGTLQTVEDIRIADDIYLKNNIEFVIGNVVDVDRRNRIAALDSGVKVKYERMIIATGSHPVLPPLKGLDLNMVFPVYKDPACLEQLREGIKGAQDITIIGGGFIGVEMAEQIKLSGDYNVTLIEALPNCLLAACGEETGQVVENELKKIGVNVLTNTLVEEIIGDKTVEKIKVSGERIIKSDLVVLGIGARPNTDLAEKIGLAVDKKMGIIVDKHMRSSDNNIFACGDCCLKYSAVTNKPTPVRLASVSVVEGSIAGSNLYATNQESRGVVGAFSTKIGDVSVAAVGFTETACRSDYINYYTGTATGPNRHPGSLPGCCTINVKLLFNSVNDRLIGGAVVGGDQAAETVNILALAIQQGLTAGEMATIQYATHPLLTGSPLVYQVLWAAKNALLNKRKLFCERDCRAAS